MAMRYGFETSGMIHCGQARDARLTGAFRAKSTDCVDTHGPLLSHGKMQCNHKEALKMKDTTECCLATQGSR
jgi:hypothetical protein